MEGFTVRGGEVYRKRKKAVEAKAKGRKSVGRRKSRGEKQEEE